MLRWQWVVLRGTLDGRIPLSKLRANALVLTTIFDQVERLNLRHVDRADCGWMSICDDLQFPKPVGIRINMMPVDIYGALPSFLEGYRSLIRNCLVVHDQRRTVSYLTIDESEVPVGHTQRRSGLHIDRPGSILDGGVRITSLDPRHRGMAWGVGRYSFDDLPLDGIYMASTVACSTKVYPVTIVDPEDASDAHGGIEHMREYLGEGRTLRANELCWLTDRTPHESLPQTSSPVYRQFFRLVVGRISHWHTRHNTRNPLGLMPDAPLTDEDKFSQQHTYDTA